MEEFTFRAASAEFGGGEAFFNEALAFEETEHERGGEIFGSRGGKSSFCFGMGVATVLAIGANDGLDEFVADDIAFVKVGEFDAIGGGEGGEGFDEARAFIGREIDLGGVSGDHGFGFGTEASEEHEHLFGGGILGFVEDDESVVEGTTAHVGEWGDFDEAPFDIALELIGFEHILEGVVEGAKIRHDLFIEIAW